MRRMMLFDRLGNPLGELAENDVFEATLREEINGEHSLEITTTRVLDKGIRLLYGDGRGKWREFSVAGVDAEHASGNRAFGTYYCVWSMQEDLQGVTVSVMPGVQNPVAAGVALTALLSTQSRWTRGTVTQMSTGGASMYDRSAWEAMSTLVDVWGGEVDASITANIISGVTERRVDLYAAQGEQTAKRRFDFGADLMGVKRMLGDGPLFCRISPRGKGEETDAGGYGRKITIESVNDGKDYLEYAPMVDAAKLPDGQGGFQYPTLIVENGDCETPADLKAWAEGVLADYCTPQLTYEINVLQTGIAGVDVTGVSLGDAVQIVDRKFGGDGIRVEGRVRSITTDLLNERDVSIVIGDAVESISSKFADVDKNIAAVNNDMTVMSTAEYIDLLLERINAEVNATGGYTYITQGQGLRTYDTAVSDPLVGSEASQVVEIKGGSIRIANSRTSQGEWDWRSVFLSGHIAADMITSAYITSGFIGSANGRVYFDLDNNELHCDTMVSTDTSNQIIANIGNIQWLNSNTVTGLKVYRSNYTSKAITVKPGDSSNPPEITSNSSTLIMRTSTRQGGGTRDTGLTGLWLCSNGVAVLYGQNAYGMTESDVSSSTNNMYVGRVVAFPRYTGSGTTYNSDGRIFIMGYLVANCGLSKFSSIEVTGTKNRRVATDGYGDRLLYCYETPSPMFGDVGSGMTDDEGVCIVSIDDIFSETARTDYDYQVFLQKRGAGDIWVDEKKPGYFTVRGTSNLAFDWELKARQSGFESMRLDDGGLRDITEQEQRNDYVDLIEDAHQTLASYEDELEELLYEAAL